MTPSKYTESLHLPCYFFDINRRFRPAAFFDIAQDVAASGATQLGAPDPVLMKRGIVWIIARQQVHFNDFPAYWSTVEMRTWHSGTRGALFTRDFEMVAEDGSMLVQATSSWALMEMSTRSLARPDRIADILPPEPQHPSRALPHDAPKILWPLGAEPDAVMQHRVVYSDLDYNGHANNARYPVWAFDFLPEEETFQRRVTDFGINFNRELHPGEVCEMRRLKISDSAWLVEGVHDNLQSFICRIDFDR